MSPLHGLAIERAWSSVGWHPRLIYFAAARLGDVSRVIRRRCLRALGRGELIDQGTFTRPLPEGEGELRRCGKGVGGSAGARREGLGLLVAVEAFADRVPLQRAAEHQADIRQVAAIHR